MAAFDSDAFDTSAFSEDAFDFGTSSDDFELRLRDATFRRRLSWGLGVLLLLLAG